MKFMLLKKPSNVFFIPKEYSSAEEVPSVLQIRYKGDMSNSKLVKCTNGRWFIKNGSRMIELKSVEINSMKIGANTADGGVFVGEISQKWFLSSKK